VLLIADLLARTAGLRGLLPDTDVPAGAKFETFVYTDRNSVWTWRVR
jgi:hypothetical protein